MPASTPPSGHPATEPAATLPARARTELSVDFPRGIPIRISDAPGRLDIMGGVADCTGSLVCPLPLGRRTAVALARREDRQLQVFSFNLHDRGEPFTLRIPLDSLARHPAARLRQEFSEPGRRWAAYPAGCLFMLHDAGRVDLRDPAVRGISLAILSDVPAGAGIASSAALEVATMIGLIDHFGIRDQFTPILLAELCRAAENRIAGAPCGVMDQVVCCAGEAGFLTRLICRPHELLAPLPPPAGVHAVGIFSGVKHEVGGKAYSRSRCAAFMGHRIIVEEMRRMGRAAGLEMIADPTGGYLANLDPDDYKRFFRPNVPESMSGREFTERFGTTSDPFTTVEEDFAYPIRHATDHHVLEARRVRRFTEFLERAGRSDGAERRLDLKRCGRLMYGSHQSYTMDAMLGAPECDLLVKLVRDAESEGLHGARISGGGCGGTVAVLANDDERADAAIGRILRTYQERTGIQPELFSGSSSGAWATGSTIV